jgi:hypothetical protein
VADGLAVSSPVSSCGVAAADSASGLATASVSVSTAWSPLRSPTPSAVLHDGRLIVGRRLTALYAAGVTIGGRGVGPLGLGRSLGFLGFVRDAFVALGEVVEVTIIGRRRCR